MKSYSISLVIRAMQIKSATRYHFTPTVLLSLVAKVCPTLCDPMEWSPSGSYVHGIFQARTLERAAISYSRVSSWPRNQTHVSCISCAGRQILYHCPSWEARVVLCKWLIFGQNMGVRVIHLYSQKDSFPVSGTKGS